MIVFILSIHNLFWHQIGFNISMKKLILLPFLFVSFISCDTKKQGIIDEQKLINKQLTGLQDSLQHAGDSESIKRMQSEVHVLQLRFDSLSNELSKFNQ